MKKLLFIIQLTTVAFLYASTSYASGGHERGYGYDHGQGWEHHEHYRHHPEERVYYREEARYYPQPEPRYYPQQLRYQSYQDPRSTQGLAGGVIGSVFGYQMGNGDPVVTGLGAAAGAYLGNGMGGRR
jgi:hypothetical protein